MIWRTEGLFSTHFLQGRLPESAHWPGSAESDTAFDTARALLKKNERGLIKGDEEECEKRFITPLLEAIGYGANNRKAIPDADARRVPDYLLYAKPTDAHSAFEAGAYYTDCIALLEAKRWGRNLSEESSGKGAAPRGRSPHYQIRDYLTESASIQWGILTNGKEWRLYCKRDRASAYFAFDLKQVLSDEDEARARADFRFFHALFRRAAFERGPDGSCALDGIRAGAEQFKEQVERDLRAQVFDCVETLALGFLETEGNNLTEADLPDIYDHCLILLYRILFVLNAEARELLPTTRANERSRKYYDSYGLQLVRDKLASPHTSAEYRDDGTFQLYARLQGLFTLINGKPPAEGRKDKNEELGIPRYNGGLFDAVRYPFLETRRVADGYLAEVLTLLSFRIESGGGLTSFDYANLGERHLGSVYEGLLEHHLLMLDGKPALINSRGERKTSGAYYTPQELVTCIVENTLEPLLPVVETTETASSDAFGIAALDLKVCDPAMGSAHFLVEAVSFLADRIAAHPTTAPRPALNNNGEPRLKNDGSQEPLLTQEAKLAYWKRRVVEACIYGVDLNPLAVELAKLSLWLKTVDRVPLNFLDHHLRCGNSLLGTDLKSLSGLPKINGNGNGNGNGAQMSFGFTAALADALAGAIADIHAIESVPTDTHDAAKRKEALWRDVTANRMPWFRQVGDLWMARWFGVDLKLIPYIKATDDRDGAATLRAEYAATLDPLRCFHWELEFPDVFFNDDGTPKANPGFDAVVTNPPWERIKLQENEFFAGRSVPIALAPKAAERRRLIAALPKTDPELWASYGLSRDRADNTLRFAQKSGFFPLMGRGDTNLYALFAEKALGLIHRRGRIGILTPSGIATDDTTKTFFQKIVGEHRLKALIDFENRRVFFPDVHSSFKFSISLITGEDLPEETAQCAFFLHDVLELKEPDRAFPLTAEDFALFNPNTRTCPIFRSRRDMELTRKIYEHAPVLVNEALGEAGNPWGISFSTMFHMTNDSKYFRTAKELEDEGYWPAAGNVYRKGPSHYLPLFEAKMIHQYDHRYAGGVYADTRLQSTQASEVTPSALKADPAFSPKPRFWVPAERVPDAPPFRIGFRDIARATDVRTCIAAVVPPVAAGNTLCLIQSGTTGPLQSCLYANLSSIALDYVARNKVSSTHLNFFVIEQFPVLPPERYAEDFKSVQLKDFVNERVLELCYTAHDLNGFADALGYTGAPFAWDEERRLHLRCQLDALYFHLYGLTRDEAMEVLETFPIVKRQDVAQYGRFRTAELVLAYYSAYDAGDMDAWVAA